MPALISSSDPSPLNLSSSAIFSAIPSPSPSNIFFVLFPSRLLSLDYPLSLLELAEPLLLRMLKTVGFRVVWLRDLFVVPSAFSVRGFSSLGCSVSVVYPLSFSIDPTLVAIRTGIFGSLSLTLLFLPMKGLNSGMGYTKSRLKGRLTFTAGPC